MTDSWVRIEYLEGSDIGRNVKEIIENEDIFTSMVTVAEVTSKMSRMGKDVNAVFSSITSLSKIIVGGPELAKEANCCTQKQRKHSKGVSGWSKMTYKLILDPRIPQSIL